MGWVRCNSDTTERTYVRTYLRTYVRRYVRTYVRSVVSLLHLTQPIHITPVLVICLRNIVSEHLVCEVPSMLQEMQFKANVNQNEKETKSKQKTKRGSKSGREVPQVPPRSFLFRLRLNLRLM